MTYNNSVGVFARYGLSNDSGNNMDTEQSEGIIIDYRGSERTPDGKTQYANFEACINLETFAGTTHFEAVGEHLAWFASELSAFYADFSGQPELVCGVGDDIYFRLKFSRHNPQGHVLVECDIRQSYRDGLFNAVRVYHVIELQQVRLIAQFFEALLVSDAPASLRIFSQY